MKSFIVNVAIAVISAAATWMFTQFTPADEISQIEYTRSTVDGYLSFDPIIANRIAITSNGKKIENISSATINFANTSKKNLENIDIEFEIEKPETGDIPEIIGRSIKGPKDFPASSISEIAKSPKGTFSYHFKVLNVSPDLATNNFQATFLFSGKVAPLVTPKIAAKGVSAVLFDAQSKVKLQLKIFLVVYFTSITALVLLAIRTGNVNRKKWDAAFTERLENYYDTRIQVAPLPSRDRFAEDIVKSSREKPKKTGFMFRAWSWLKGA